MRHRARQVLLMRHTRRQLRTVALVLLLAARGEGCAFSVGPDGLCASLRLEPANAVVGVGETLRIRVNGGACLDSCLCDTEPSAAARWRSDAPKVASVDAAGTVTGLGPGTATIVRDTGSGAKAVRGSMRVTVVP